MSDTEWLMHFAALGLNDFMEFHVWDLQPLWKFYVVDHFGLTVWQIWEFFWRSYTYVLLTPQFWKL